MNEHHLATEQMERLSPTTPPTEQGDTMPDGKQFRIVIDFDSPPGNAGVALTEITSYMLTAHALDNAKVRLQQVTVFDTVMEAMGVDGD